MEYECPFCGSTVEKTNSHCAKCGAELDWTGLEAMPEEGEEMQHAGTREVIEEEIVQAEKEGLKEQYDFKTLLGFGKFISGLGWVLVVLGLFGILSGLVTSGPARILAVIGGIYVITYGILIVASGQAISCFVAIERNTRLTYKLLKLKERE